MTQDIIRKYIDIINENQNVFLSADGDEIPAVVYHGTTLENWEKYISRQGLDPSKTQYDDEWDHEEHNKGYVFLAWDIGTAKAFAPGGVYNKYPAEGVIIKVKLDKQLASTIRTSLGEFLRCPVVIPPRYLTVIEVTNRVQTS